MEPEPNKWTDVNAGRVVYEAQERYRAELRRSLLAVARRRITSRRSARTSSDAVETEGSRGASANSAKSVAAQQRDGLARELAYRQAENEKLRHRIEELKSRLHEHKVREQLAARDKPTRDCEVKVRAAEQRAAELGVLVSEKQAEIDDANAQIKRLTDERDSTAKELAAEEANTVTATEQAVSAKLAVAALEHDLEAALLAKHEASGSIKDLQNELDMALSRARELQSVAMQYDAEQKRLTAEITELEVQKSKLETQQNGYETHIAALEQRLQRVQEDIASRDEGEQKYRTTISEYEVQIAGNGADLEAAHKRASELMVQYDNSKLQVAELTNLLNAATEEIERLQSVETQLQVETEAHSTTKQALADALDSKEQLKLSLATHETSVSAAESKVDLLRSQLEESLRTRDQVRAAIANESSKVKMQQKLVAELQSETEGLEAKRSAAVTSYHQEHSRLLATAKEAAELRAKCRKLEAFQQEHERSLQELNAENRKLYEERLELAQGFEKEVGVREASERKLQSACLREQSLLSEINDLNERLVTRFTAYSSEVQEAQDRASVLEQELKHVMRAQSQRTLDSESVKSLQGDLIQTGTLLKHERHRVRHLQNQIQDLKGNIRVVVRVRPSSMEPSSSLRLTSGTVTLTGKENSCKGIREVVKVHHFDRVFGPEASNQAVNEETEYLVQSALDGHNVCIFAYGQTGSGKTWTMGSSDGVSMSAIDAVMAAAASSRDKSSVFEYSIAAESVEIYNEQFRDLLDDSPMLTGPVTGLITGPIARQARVSLSFGGTARDGVGVALRVNEKTRLPELVGSKRVDMRSAEQARELYAKAARSRSVAATAANARSSRSHFVFVVHIERRHKHSTDREPQKCVLNLVDLAGSERLAHSKTTGDRLVETNAINSSLSTLGNVIKTLANREGPRAGDRRGEPARAEGHLTYRDSKLTHLLQGSLSGSSKAMLLATLSPEPDHANETRSTLQFAETASRATVRHNGRGKDVGHRID